MIDNQLFQTVRLRPGHLVSIRTRTRGGVTRSRRVMSSDRDDESNRLTVRSESVEVISDPEEYRAAQRLRTKLYNRMCARVLHTPMVMICLDSQLETFQRVVRDCRAIADDFNARSQHTKIILTVITGRMPDDDIETVRAITTELSAVMYDMDAAVVAGDRPALTTLAAKAHDLNTMIEDQRGLTDSVSQAVRAARNVAALIAKRVEKGSLEWADLYDRIDCEPFNVARLAVAAASMDPDAFVDMDDQDFGMEDL